MDGYQGGMNQANTPPIPAPSGIPAPPSNAGAHYASVQGAAQAPQTGVSFTPMSAKSSRRIKRIALAVVACVILAVVAVVGVTVANWARTPEAKVREYLELLAAGKASAATSMVDPDLPNDQRGYLTDEVMASASARLEIEDIVASDSGRSKDYAVVATMRLNGERFTRLFRVSQASSTLGVLKNWKIQDALVSRVHVGGRFVPAFSVGGVKTEKSAEEGTGTTIIVYPGVYTFTPEDLGDYVAAEAKTAPVKASEEGAVDTTVASVEFEAHFTDKLEQAALEAAAAATNSCGTVPGNIDKMGPFQVQSKTLALLEIKKLPASMKAEARSPLEFVGQAVFRLQGMSTRGDSEPYDLESTVTATVKLDEKGKMKLDASGKPEFEIKFS